MAVRLHQGTTPGHRAPRPHQDPRRQASARWYCAHQKGEDPHTNQNTRTGRCQHTAKLRHEQRTVAKRNEEGDLVASSTGKSQRNGLPLVRRRRTGNRSSGTGEKRGGPTHELLTRSAAPTSRMEGTRWRAWPSRTGAERRIQAHCASGRRAEHQCVPAVPRRDANRREQAPANRAGSSTVGPDDRTTADEQVTRSDERLPPLHPIRSPR